MEIIRCKDYEEMSQKAASLAAQSIKENPQSLISFPGGDTPLGMVRAFVDMANTGEIDISSARYVSLDEWVGLSQADEGSCGLFNKMNLIRSLMMPFAETHIINGKAPDMVEECKALNQFIETYGPLDVSVLGIGMNGHLGFNEAGVDFNLKGHIISLDDTTKKVMKKYFGEKFHPSQGITQGIAQIMSASKVILIANGAHKADILYRAVHGPITPQVPASILQNHPKCYLVADEAAASQL